jgi:hypothetical protein
VWSSIMITITMPRNRSIESIRLFIFFHAKASGASESLTRLCAFAIFAPFA